ncbi:MAG: glutaredoxin 3 [Gammaproteobacteria bacterium]|nr:glutaredoxin 3 [Gammaproteobacteria bacterium]
MYGTEFCSYCMAARMLFKKKGIDVDEISVSGDPERFEEMQKMSGRRSVPQIFINDNAIGGFDELYCLEQSGDLDELLTQE